MIQNGGAIDEGRDWQETFTQVAKDFFLKSVVVPQIPHATGKLKIMPIRGQGETGKTSHRSQLLSRLLFLPSAPALLGARLPVFMYS